MFWVYVSHTESYQGRSDVAEDGFKTAAGHPPCEQASPEMDVGPYKQWPTRRRVVIIRQVGFETGRQVYDDVPSHKAPF
jgi:hypothetical protein